MPWLASDNLALYEIGNNTAFSPFMNTFLSLRILYVMTQVIMCVFVCHTTHLFCNGKLQLIKLFSTKNICLLLNLLHLYAPKRHFSNFCSREEQCTSAYEMRIREMTEKKLFVLRLW